MALIALTLQSLLLLGIGTFVIQFLELLADIQATGTGDPRVVAGGISQALVPMLITAVPGALGLALNLALIWGSRLRARWYFWASLLLGSLHVVVWGATSLALLKLGAGLTLIGVAMLLSTGISATLVGALIRKRHEFFAASGNSAQA